MQKEIAAQGLPDDRRYRWGEVRLKEQRTRRMQNSLVQKLRVVPLFRDLDDAELLDVLRPAVVRSYAKGTVVVKEGEPGSSMFVILNGKAKVTASHWEDMETLLAYLGKGHFFGEMALLSNQPRSATVTATEDMTALEVSKTGLEDAFMRRPALRDTLERYRHGREQDKAQRLMPFDGHERRLHRRLPVAAPCRLRLTTRHGGRMVTKIVCGMTSDISEAGLKMEIDGGQLSKVCSPLPGTKLRLEVELPGQRNMLRMGGEVRWCRQSGQGADSQMELGILITHMAKRDNDAWLRFIHSEETTHTKAPRAARVHTIEL